MDIFISWSGERSKLVAEALAAWLPEVIQSLKPWVSFAMDKGIRWSPEIAKRLRATPVGIFCLTRENLTSEWLHFEAGAISKVAEGIDESVCTYLLGMEPTDVTGPLSQFQHTRATKDDTLALLRTINKAADAGLSDAQVERAFHRCWPDLESKLKAAAAASSERVPLPPVRGDRELLQEVLELVRNLAATRPTDERLTVQQKKVLQALAVEMAGMEKQLDKARADVIGAMEEKTALDSELERGGRGANEMMELTIKARLAGAKVTQTQMFLKLFEEAHQRLASMGLSSSL